MKTAPSFRAVLYYLLLILTALFTVFLHSLHFRLHLLHLATKYFSMLYIHYWLISRALLATKSVPGQVLK